MGKKKKQTDKQEEDLLLWAANLPNTIIYGRLYARIRYDGSKGAHCPGCHKKKGSYHDTACFLESCPVCRGTFVSCNCDPDIENAERDNFVECLDNG